MKKSIMIVGIMFLGIGIFLAGFADSFGIGSEYWKGNPLYISAGETKTVYLTLQNMVGTEDVTVKTELKEGAEIASIDSNKEYFVKAGTQDTKFPVTINIPENTPLDASYVVTISFRTITPGNTGAVVIGTGIDTSFDVLVVPFVPVETTGEGVLGGNTFDEGNLLTIVVLIILIILIIIVIIIYKKRKRTRELREFKKNNRR